MIAVGAIVVVIILAVLLIHHVQVNQTKNSLKNYAANVNSLVHDSNANGKHMFRDLQSGELNSNSISTLDTDLTTELNKAQQDLTRAEQLSAPGQVAEAQTDLVRMMQLRVSGISEIATNIQDAVSTNTSSDAVYQISVGTSELYASDVLYKTFVTTGIAKALNGANILIGGTTGAQINAGQIIPDLGWLNKTFIDEKIGASLPTKVANTAGPGLHGHQLNGVSVGTTELGSSTNTIPASPAPTFTLSITNGGTTNEYDVECKVSVSGLSDLGTATIPETTPGQTTTCSVTLPFPPTAGTYSVTATVVPVPGEANKTNNTATFPVIFN
jgi:CARDB